MPLVNDHHNKDSSDEYFEDNENYECTEEVDDEDHEELEFEEEEEGEEEQEIFENVSPHDENNEVQLNCDDTQIELANNQDSSIQPVIRHALLGIAKKRPNSNVVASMPSSPKQPHKKTKLKVQVQTERFTLQINECLICPAILGDILQLKEHIEAHQHIKCKACHRQFVRYSNLKRHFNAVHSKPKPFICDICGLGFNFSVNLQSHASLHYSGKIQNET